MGRARVPSEIMTLSHFEAPSGQPEPDHAISAGDICEEVPPVAPDTRVETVVDLFTEQPDLFGQPVVDADGTPLGLLNRFRLLDRLSRRFGRDLFIRRPVIDCLDMPALLVDEHSRIEDVGSRLFDGDRTHVHDGFIVTRAGKYRGIGTGVTLTRALTDLTLVRARVAAEKAANENAAKTAFVSNVSHEIRTPLNGVLGIATLLQDTELSREQREMVDLLRISGEALMGLVEDVLDYSRIESGSFETKCAPFSLRALISDAVKILGVRADAKGVRVASDVDSRLPDVVMGDASRLRQVLLNVGGNAVKFTSDGVVSLRVRTIASTGSTVVEFQIEDTGIGIPREKLGLLFRPFYQVDSSHARQYGGTGLGLTISRQIVERLGGEIRVTSDIGRGSVFTFTMPLALPPAFATAAASHVTPSDAPAHSAMRVLLAEDNPTNQLVATRLLQKLGCSVHVVSDGAAAVAALSDEVFDLVLMDCNMPAVDGYEATRRIRDGVAGHAARNVTIVALTASATTDNHAACIAAGMDGFLSKPLGLPSLQRELSRWPRTRLTTT